MKRKPFLRQPLALLGLLCLAFAPLSSAFAVEETTGISFHVNRLVYLEADKKGIVHTAYNKTDRNWLMQSFIRPVDQQTGDIDIDNKSSTPLPFIVTPPLERMSPHSELTVRIRRNQIALPDDRESVFFVSLKAIPAQQKNEANNPQAVIAIVNSMKLFYRPEGLKKRAVAEVASQLTFRKDGKRLIAVNPTPYWFTLARLQVGSAELDKEQLRLMIPPKGEREYLFPHDTSGVVEWQLVDEDGWKTSRHKQE